MKTKSLTCTGTTDKVVPGSAEKKQKTNTKNPKTSCFSIQEYQPELKFQIQNTVHFVTEKYYYASLIKGTILELSWFQENKIFRGDVIVDVVQFV